MTKVAKSAITAGRSLDYAVDTSFHGYELSYPLLGIESCHYEASLTKVGGRNHADYVIDVTMRLEDSRDAVAFLSDKHIEESADILDEEDDEGEGYIVPGNSVDLDEIALRIIVSSLPIKVVRPEPAKKVSGKGFRLLSEEEETVEYNPAFDKLKDLEL